MEIYILYESGTVYYFYTYTNFSIETDSEFESISNSPIFNTSVCKVKKKKR